MQAWTQRNVTGENLDEPSTEADTSV
jgi:hypothetical protein